MAVTPGQRPKGFTEIDPTEEATIRRIDLWAPDPLTFDRDRGELIYDRPSDTLLILFHGRDRDSFAVNIAGDFLVLADPDSDEIIGIQVEDFLHSAVKVEPELIRASCRTVDSLADWGHEAISRRPPRAAAAIR